MTDKKRGAKPGARKGSLRWKIEAIECGDSLISRAGKTTQGGYNAIHSILDKYRDTEYLKGRKFSLHVLNTIEMETRTIGHLIEITRTK